MQSNQNVSELLLEHEREKCARLEALSKRADTIITALQEENRRIGTELEEARKHPFEDDRDQKDVIETLSKRIIVLESELEKLTTKATSATQGSGTEVLTAQREVIRLNKRLSTCEKALQEAMDERETLIVRLKNAQRSVVDVLSCSATSLGIKNVVNPQDAGTPGQKTRTCKSPDANETFPKVVFEVDYII